MSFAHSYQLSAVSCQLRRDGSPLPLPASSPRSGAFVVHNGGTSVSCQLSAVSCQLRRGGSLLPLQASSPRSIASWIHHRGAEGAEGAEDAARTRLRALAAGRASPRFAPGPGRALANRTTVEQSLGEPDWSGVSGTAHPSGERASNERTGTFLDEPRREERSCPVRTDIARRASGSPRLCSRAVRFGAALVAGRPVRTDFGRRPSGSRRLCTRATPMAAQRPAAEEPDATHPGSAVRGATPPRSVHHQTASPCTPRSRRARPGVNLRGLRVSVVSTEATLRGNTARSGTTGRREPKHSSS
jgi:hypothetical protein